MASEEDSHDSDSADDERSMPIDSVGANPSAALRGESSKAEGEFGATMLQVESSSMLEVDGSEGFALQKFSTLLQAFSICLFSFSFF